MVNKTTGLSKGYGFVSFAFVEDAAAAIDFMDGFRVSCDGFKTQKYLTDLESIIARKEEIEGSAEASSRRFARG